MKFSKKMLAFVLSAIMILGAMAPVTAMAAETTQPSISAANVTLRYTGDPLKINLTYSGDDTWAGKTDGRARRLCRSGGESDYHS